MAFRSFRQNCLSSVCDPVGFIGRREIGNTQPNTSSDKFMRHRTSLAKNLYKRELKAHYGCVNAIEFSHKGGQFMSSGGDDRRVLLWNVEKALSDIGSPKIMKGEHNSNIFCIAFDRDNKKIFSGGNDEQVLVHDIESGATLEVFMHDDAIYGLTSDPNNVNVFASACDDGRILVFDIREPASTDPFCLANYTSSMHAVAYNPVEPRLLATANAREGIGLWDIRKPKSCLLRYGSGLVQQSCMSVCVSKMGDRLLALRRRLPPVLYDIKSPFPLCEFDHAGYYNSCTMKSCSFAGDRDQYVLSGSDDCNLYMWKIPDDLSKRQFVNDAHMVLHGHRSIVNQVRFNAANHLILSSGVEKSIKVWSPFPVPTSEGGIDSNSVKKNAARPAYSHEEYINLVLQTGHVMTHDYSSQSVEEDPRMLAFFDSLVQRELEGFSSSEDFASSDEELLDRIENIHDSDFSDSDSHHSRHATQNRTSSNHNQENGQEDSTVNSFSVTFASAANSRSLDGNAVSSGNMEHYSEISNSSDNDTDSENNSLQGGKTIEKLIKERCKQIKLNGKTKRKRPLVTYSSDSSDSEKDDNTASDSSTHREQVQGHPLNILSACKQRNHLQLKRLKLLRDSALNSDSDLDDAGSLELNEKNSIHKNGACENLTENSKCEENNKCKNTEEDMGPYLYEAENQPSCSKTLAGPSSDSFPIVENHEGPQNSESEVNSQQKWSEFKRLKTKATSRKYRSHSKAEDN
ncbi:DDB1- and CUL4-associated factor 5-like [Mytilus californianus]|uniref:DDB1- and CUL4-associated factor 5-like n=1 Tax=Mytilus californianus TaxID=6549 RepID=UPI002245A17E|nr:DDB1- and CUL4-associated factor 5-like [Mytilus californianus]